MVAGEHAGKIETLDYKSALRCEIHTIGHYDGAVTVDRVRIVAKHFHGVCIGFIRDGG